MSRRAVIFGCGYTGTAIGRLLHRRGFRVTGVKRSWDRTPEGIHRVEADVTKPDSLRKLDGEYSVAVNCVAAGARGNPQRYEQVYERGGKNLVEWGSGRVRDLFVYTGSSSVYAQSGGQWVDEGSPAEPDRPSGNVLRRAEELHREAARRGDLPAVVLRLTGIYGPGRTRSVDRYREGRTVLRWGGGRYRNSVHRDDIARAVVRMSGDPAPGEMFNLSDCEPVTERVFYLWLSRRLGGPRPPVRDEKGRRRSNKRVCSRRFRRRFGFDFRYPTFREGLSPLLEESIGRA